MVLAEGTGNNKSQTDELLRKSFTTAEKAVLMPARLLAMMATIQTGSMAFVARSGECKAG
jgi:hypothetical protein